MSRAVLRVRRTYIIMREKVDILPLKGRTDDLPKPDKSEKRSGRKKAAARARGKKEKK